MRRNTSSGTNRDIEALLDQLVATCTPHLRRTAGTESLLCRTGSHILPSLHITSNPLSHTRTLQVSGRTPLKLWCSSQRCCERRQIRATQGMSKRKTFNRPALSCTSTRTHLERRRSVELMNLPFKPCPRAPRIGVLVTVWRLPIDTDIVPQIYFLFTNMYPFR